ncbi:MAG: transcriptional regulator with XRE-family HTH domain, partial [Bacteriovoracaceae bacterium]
RKTAGLSQIEMAKILQRDQATISRLEKGTQSLSVESVFVLSKFFEINYEDLLSGHVNYWQIAKKFDVPMKINPKYIENSDSLVRELVPLMRLIIRKRKPEGLKSFLNSFGLDDLIYMGPSERISFHCYFDLLQGALESKLVNKDDIPELIATTQSSEYHGSFYNVYERQSSPIEIIKAYCYNSSQYEGAFEHNVIDFSDRAVTIGLKVKDFASELDFSNSGMGSFIVDYKQAFFSALPQAFGYEALIAKTPTNKKKNFKEEVSFKLIQSA